MEEMTLQEYWELETLYNQLSDIEVDLGFLAKKHPLLENSRRDLARMVEAYGNMLNIIERKVEGLEEW